MGSCVVADVLWSVSISSLLEPARGIVAGPPDARLGARPRALRAREALRVEALAAGWGKQRVLHDLSLRVMPGEQVAILGPNGAGKTTLFDAITGRLQPSGGRVWLSGTDLARRPLHERALLGLGYVTQEPCVFADMTVRDNLIAALQSPVAARAGLPTPAEARRAADVCMETWSLSDLATRPAGVLSGGERRRLEVARAFLLRPRLLLLDEPFTGLDPPSRRLLSDGLAAVGPGMALVVTDHRAEDVLEVCGRVVVLVDGGIAFDGPTRDFQPGAAGYRRYFGS